jgi:hypothetical protein
MAAPRSPLVVVRRSLWVVGTCGIAACASKGDPDPETAIQGQQSTRVVTPGVQTSGVMQTRANTEDYIRRATVSAPLERAWPAVVGAYEDLKIPVTLRVDASRQIGSQGRRFRGSIGGTRLGLLFDCGNAASGGDAADVYEVTVDLTTTLAPGTDATSSSVQSVALAMAKPMMTSGEPVRCMSTGRLESKILDATTKRLGA